MPIPPIGSPAHVVAGRPRTGPSRSFVRLEQLELKADELRRTAAMRLELPLSSFVPPLRRENVEGLSVRLGGPIGDGSILPLEVLERGGHAYLVVDVLSVPLSWMTSTPLVLAIGEPKFLSNVAVASPNLLVQVSTACLVVDVGPSVKRELRERVGQLNRAIEESANTRGATAAGTSSWFGSRQLTIELGTARERVLSSTKALNGLLATATSAWERATPDQRAVGAPVDDAVRTRWRLLLTDAANAQAKLPAAREGLAMAVDARIAELVASDREEVDQLEARASQAVLVESEVSRAFETLPDVAQARWLVEFAGIVSFPVADELSRSLREALIASADVQVLEEKLAQLSVSEQAELGPRLQQLDAKLASLRREREDASHRLSVADSIPERWAVAYAADLAVI